MSELQDHKSLKNMIQHYKNMKYVSPTSFNTSINNLTLMANGGDLGGERSSFYPYSFHTDQFFIDLLRALGYDKNGNLLDI